MVANAAATAKMTGVGTARMGLYQRRRDPVVPSTTFRRAFLARGDAVSLTGQSALEGRFLDRQSSAFPRTGEQAPSTRRCHVRDPGGQGAPLGEIGRAHV